MDAAKIEALTRDIVRQAASNAFEAAAKLCDRVADGRVSVPIDKRPGETQHARAARQCAAIIRNVGAQVALPAASEPT